MFFDDLSQIEPTSKVLNLKYFLNKCIYPILIFVMNEDLIHHRLRESHQSQTSMMNFIRKVVEIDETFSWSWQKVLDHITRDSGNHEW